MSEVLQANIFFVVTSIAVVVVTVLLAIVLFRAMRILKSIQEITDRFKRGSEVLAEDAMAVRDFVSSGVVATVKKVIADSKEKFTKKTPKREKKEKHGTTSTDI